MARRWFRLDNAAKLYPAVANDRWSSVFRLSAELDMPLEPALLQQAVNDVLPRFPTLNVRMRRGIFWYYLEENDTPLQVTEDTGHPCMRFLWKEKRLLRIHYFRNRVSCEFFHALTDGTGGLIFLRTLLTRYLQLTGESVTWDHGACDPGKAPVPAETQDAFLKLPLPRVRVRELGCKAWHMKGTREIPHTLHVISALINTEALTAAARDRHVTVTEYMTAVLLYTCCQDQLSGHPRRLRPMRVQVPVNLRRWHSPETLRNFSTFVIPEIDPRLGEYTFEETLKSVHAYMAYHVDFKRLCAGIASNVADEKNLFMRLTPLPVKNMVIASVFRKAGDKVITTVLSNPGCVDLSPVLQKHVTDMEMLLGKSPCFLTNCALLTANGHTRLTFTSGIREHRMEQSVLHFLTEQGIPVTVRSNLEDN